MDKGKNRTDLLAAGRKKLQQYRQRKETKSSSTHGKSLKKSSKEEFDLDADTASASGKLSSEFQPDGGELPDIGIKLESHLSENSIATEIEVEDTGTLAIPATHSSHGVDRTEVQSTELPQRELSSCECVDSSVVNTEVDASVGAASDIIVSEVDSKSFDDSVSVDISAKPGSVVALEGVGFEVQVEGRDGTGDASSSSQESVLPLLPIQGMNNQEVNGFESKQSDEGGAVDRERGGNLPFCELGGGTEIPSAANTLDTSILERSRDAEGSGNSGEASILLADSASTSGFVGAMTNLTIMKECNQQHTQAESFGDDDKGKTERLCNGGSFVPPITNMYPVSVLQLRELINTLSDEEFSVILESRESVSDDRPMIGSLPDDSCYHMLEKLKEELILSDLTNNICQLLTSDQSMAELELDCLRHDNVLLKEACQRNQTIIEELAQCRLELQDALGSRDEFEKELTAANAEVKEISTRAYQLEMNLGRSQDDFSKLLIELDNLRCEMESLNGTVASLTEDIHKLKHEKEFLLHENEKISAANNGLESSLTFMELENSKLVASLSSLTEEKKKLEEEVAFLSQENKRLSKEVVDCNSLATSLQLEISDLQRNLTLLTVERTEIGEDKEYLSIEKENILLELVVLREALSVENAKYSSLENTLNEVKGCNEQLTEDNIFLYQKLNVYETTLREIDYTKSLTLCQAAEDENQAVNGWRKSVGGGTEIAMLEQGTHDNSLELSTLKQNSEKANNILQKLEKALEGLRLQSLSLTKPNNKSAAPSISKLIQAFELKASTDEHEVMERAVNESQLPVDPFTLMKELTVNLRKVLLQIEMTAESASMVVMNERCDHESSKASYANLKEQYDALEGHSQGVMTNNIELGVLYDATKVHMADAGTRIVELELAIDILSQENCSLKVAVGELTTKLCTYETKISELTDQISYLQQSSNEMASLVSTQLDNLKNEAAERASTLENDWNSLATQTLETTRKLDESVAKCISLTDITRNYERFDNSTVSERVAASVNVAVTVIKDLKQKLDNAHTENKAINSLCEEVNEKYESLHGMNELTLALLNKVYCVLHNILSGSVSRNDLNVQIEMLPNPIDYVYFETIMKQLEDFLSERLELQSMNNNLSSKLMNKSKELEDISRISLDSVSIKKLVEDIHVALKLEDTDDNLNEAPASHLMSLILLLVQKFAETNAQIELSRVEFGSKMMEFTEMQERIHELNTITLQQENEILLLRETSNQMEEDLITAHAELKEKIGELEQSEQRVTSIREKLSIAVAKGKGLVVQRDSLKHSLAEKSSELEKCIEELKLKETRLHELDLKLNYSEAGGRVEALESELSYIRNSATALRESFLLKDSVLQRIEEILEDLELPEHYHSKDIIEKVDWLARSTLVNSGPQTDYDQKTYPAEGTYSDDSFVVMDDRKDGLPTGTISDEHLRLKYEELQSKFYGLAEQNEMLEQSLMLRNNLVQRWEELLDMINIPSHLQSLDPEDRIEWLGKELSVVQSDRSSLQQKVDYFENLCGSLTTDLGELRKNFRGLEADFQALNSDRESLFRKYETLFSDNERLLVKAVENEVGNVILHHVVNQLQENLCYIDSEIQTLQDLVSDVLQGFEIKDLVSASSIDCLGEMVRKLIDEYMLRSVLENSSPKENIEETAVVLDATRSIDTLDSSKFDADVQKKELDDALLELMCAREERDKYIGMYQYSVSEVESLGKKMIELQELLNQEEQKSASVREKLNVAVRKGKSLVQQRDSLKQTIEGMTNELDCLKTEIKRHENAVASYELKIKDLSFDSERVEALESENLLLRNRMAEKEDILREKEHILSMILETLGDIDVGVNSSNPVVKLKEIGKQCYDLRASVVSLEQESKKSRRAAELLLTELNEVQERNDAFQDELAQASHELAELAMERDRAEASRFEALSHIEKLSSIQSDEKKSQFSEFVGLISCVDELRKTFHDINHFIVVILSKDLEFWQNVGTNVQSCHNVLNPVDVVAVPLSNASVGFKSWNSDDKGMEINFLGHLDENFVVEEVIGSISHHLKEFKMEIDDLETMLNKHSVIIREQATCISKLVLAVLEELTSQKESVDALKRQVSQMELGSKEKDMEVEALHKNIGLLHEACTHLVMEIEQKNAELVGNSRDYKDFGTLNPRASTLTGQLLMDEHPNFSSEDYIQRMTGRVLSAVREFAGLKADIIGGSQDEMKITIENLQKELQDKDIQKDRICTELVGQIKKAEATSTSYSLDLQYSKTRVHDLDKLVEDMKGERVRLEHKIKELEAGLTGTLELEERVKSLLGMVSSKDQEIEALMQALDEEEIQMEDLTNKIKELEKDLKLKNQELEDLEASRGKVIKKLAVTVSKFDELHHLSGSLLTEVESLQSQLLDRDTEISFLRQEVTRCANDVLVASQTNSTKTSEEICKYLTWFDTMISRDGVYDVHHDDKDSWIMECKEQLQKKIASILTEIEDLEMLAQSKDELLQMERNKFTELTKEKEMLEKSLRDKEQRLNMLEAVAETEKEAGGASEISEAEPLIKKWIGPGTSMTPQVRGTRKINTDQVAIAIDMDHGAGGRLEDEDDDKGHGFKSLTTSKIVPKFTRPVADMVDGLWVSCDRALMRQPSLRLGIIIYWAVLHALLATFVV